MTLVCLTLALSGAALILADTFRRDDILAIASLAVIGLSFGLAIGMRLGAFAP